MSNLQQASQWHDERFTPRHAIWRASDGRTCDSVRGDAGQVTLARILFPQCLEIGILCKASLEIGMPSRTISVARVYDPDTCKTNGLRHDTKFGVPIERRNRDSVRGDAVRARPWQEFQNVHVTARIGTPCHSIVAPSLLIVYELFMKWHERGTTISLWQVVSPWKLFLNISKILAMTWNALLHLTRIPTHPHAHLTWLSHLLLFLPRMALNGLFLCWCAVKNLLSLSLSHTSRVLPLLACRLSCQCQACFKDRNESPWLRSTKTARLGAPILGHYMNKIRANVMLAINKTHWCLTVCAINGRRHFCARNYSTVETLDDTAPVIDPKAKYSSKIAIFAPVMGTYRRIAIRFGTKKN